MTGPVTTKPPTSSEHLTASHWLDSYATGACDQAAFFHGVGILLQHAPDAGWELLALVDQYYRRGKIGAESFTTLKSHLQAVLIGTDTGEISVPLRHARTPRNMPAAPPAVAVPQMPAKPAAVVPEKPVQKPAQLATQAISPTRSAREAARSAGEEPIDANPRVKPQANKSPATPQPAAPASVDPPSIAWGRPPGAAKAAAKAATPRRPMAASRSISASMAPAVDDEAHVQRMLKVGDVLRDRYRIVALLGQGGMGTVFAAVDQYRLDRDQGDQKVAIKVLHTAVIQRPRLFAELRREFQHLQSLTHPNIVRVHEFDRDGDLAFFSMEYLSGALLTQLVAVHVATALHRPYAFAIVRDVGAAVAHAHARGVVHGDLNPGNIFVTDAGDVRVLDFGAAHPLRRGPWISDFEGSQQITVATPRFASCQLLEGETAEARDDIYALACITYVLLTGSHPFRDHSALKARTLGLRPSRPAGITTRQWTALRAGLDFERDRRPRDMSAWMQELASDTAVAHLPELPLLLTVRPQRRSGKGWIAAIAAIAMLALGTWWATGHVDGLNDVKADGVARVKAAFANSVISQWWDHGRGDAATQKVVMPASRDVDQEGPPAKVPATAKLPATVEKEHGPSPGNLPQRVDTAPASDMRPPDTKPAMAATKPRPGLPAPAAAANPASLPAANALHARLELATDSIELAPGDTVAHVVVRRTRTLRGDVSFNWWTESGTAKAGRDFTPIKTQLERIADGRNAAMLNIPVTADSGKHDARSFYVVIDSASENAALGPRTLTMVTLPGAE